MELEGKVQRLGFYTNRHIEASDIDDVEALAVLNLRNEEKLRDSICNLQDDPPMIYVEEIEEIEVEDVPSVQQGLAFFVQEANS